MQAPQDPSFMINAQLLPHLHLISSYAFPLHQRISPEQALSSLLQAPQIVREMKPMAWTYLAPPQDGQMFIAWQTPRMGAGFATDGYVWTDPEATYRHPTQGYTLEILVHRAGYVYGREQIASHQRMRYHIIDKDPSQPGNVDKDLWLVHYGPCDPSSRHAVNQFPLHPQVQQSLKERQWLEQQGGLLQRKEFMLYDRANWPAINSNARLNAPQIGMHPAGGMYQMNPMAARQHPQMYQQAQIQQPPMKKPRVDRGVAAAVTSNMPTDDIYKEEDTEFGDYLDNLTPAEISKVRYKQHHQWMEEIYSSVYSLSQIVPEDLGLGLTGSLKQLTDGIFNTPDPQDVIKPFDPNKDEHRNKNMNSRQRYKLAGPGSHVYQKLTPEKMDEFELRIAQYVEKGKAEIQAMKNHHAETVSNFKKSRSYMIAERKLRDTNGADIDLIVKEVEDALQVKIHEQKNKVCVEEGGLEKEDKSRVNGGANGNGSSNNFNGDGITNFGGEDNSAAGLLDEFGSGSYANSPTGRVSTPHISQPHSEAPTPGATAGPNQQFMQQQNDVPNSEQAPDETGLDLIEGMDLDVDMSGLQDDVGVAGAEDEWVMVPQDQEGQSGAEIGSNKATVNAPQQSDHQPPTSMPEQGQAGNKQRAENAHGALSTSNNASAGAGTDTNTPAGAGDSGAELFDTPDFGTFDNLDTAGDALADFNTPGDDDLGLDLDNSAFGDAFGTGAEQQDDGHGV